jgi:hypothetical protein
MFARLSGSGRSNFVVELLMIVAGINIALWFEGVFEDMEDAETEQQYLEGLHNDLTYDVDNLEKLIRGNGAKIESLTALLPSIGEFSNLPVERQAAAISEPSSYLFFNPSDFTYQSMQESGDFRLLRDDTIKKDLLKLARYYRLIDELQANFIQAMDAEYIPLMMSKFDLATNRITDPSIMDDQIFKNFFIFTIQDTDARLDTYKTTRELAKKLLLQIESNLNVD